MEIKEIIDHDSENYGQYSGITIEVNGKRRLGISGGEPEDMTLGRALSDVYNVTTLMEEAYNAGKAGEEFNVITEEIGE